MLRLTLENAGSDLQVSTVFANAVVGMKSWDVFFNFIFLFYLMKVMAGANSRYHFREGLSFGGY